MSKKPANNGDKGVGSLGRPDPVLTGASTGLVFSTAVTTPGVTLLFGALDGLLIGAAIDSAAAK